VTKRNRPNLVRVPQNRADRRPIIGAPESRHPILTSGQDDCTVRTDLKLVHGRSVNHRPASFQPPHGIPNPSLAVVAPEITALPSGRKATSARLPRKQSPTAQADDVTGVISLKRDLRIDCQTTQPRRSAQRIKKLLSRIASLDRRLKFDSFRHASRAARRLLPSTEGLENRTRLLTLISEGGKLTHRCSARDLTTWSGWSHPQVPPQHHR
jgi:hypothetical protein